ncbi:MAG: hypothetical protein HZB91_06295 [Elusimicrobia bacterium]|nr:hypothetical protein [Elusimicrobiota bacterium]
MMKRHGSLNLAVRVAAGLAFCVTAASAAPSASAVSQRRFVNGQIWKNGSSSYSVNEYSLGVNLWVNGSGSNLYFSGRPFSGSVWGSGSYFTISGAGVNASVNKWGGNYSVSGTIHPQGGGQALRVNFTMNALGREDDPNNPPSYNLYDYASGANINFQPNGRDGYNMSGWMDDEKFGASGTALAGLVVTIAIESRPHAKPKAEERAPRAEGKLTPLPCPL